MTEQPAPTGGDEDLVATGRGDASFLVWGIKPSFLRYVVGVGGEITCGDGAVHLGEPFGNGFGFPLVGVDDEGSVDEGVDDEGLRTRGEVRIRAHGGLLDVRIRELRLIPADTGEMLTVAASDATSRLTLATAEHSPAAASLTAPFHLHSDAVALFDGTYPPGTELDPVRFFRPRT